MANKLTIGKKVKGKTTYFFPLFNGLRISRDLFRLKWEAEKLGKAYLDFKNSTTKK